MANAGYIVTLLGALDEKPRKILREVFDYLVPNTRFGPVEHQTKSESFQAYFVSSTTAASTSEFSIQHGMSVAPHTAIPVLDLTTVGASLPRLEVSRAADANRVYLKSPDLSTPFTLLIE